jgi:hypothetical protein
MMLVKCIAEIQFNQQCLLRDLIPKYPKMGIPNTSPVAKYSEKDIKNKA